MSNSKILTSQEVGEIEARLKDWDGGAQFPASWNSVRALCATVRHLLSENEKLKSLAAEALREIPQTRDTRATRVRVTRELEQLK